MQHEHVSAPKSTFVFTKDKACSIAPKTIRGSLKMHQDEYRHIIGANSAAWHD